VAQTVALIDYESGNVRSVARALEAVGDVRVALTSDPAAILAADRIVLPGQGAFSQCMGALSAKEGVIAALDEAIRQRGTPFLGVCVGMQLLMTEGEEHGARPGLGWIPGACRLLETSERLPHMGWNEVAPTQPHPVLDALAPRRHAYFAHSFVVEPQNAADAAALTTHGSRFVSAVARDVMVGVQFHPEKSQTAGLDLLARFLAWTP
jgi:imidazole glycerol-phosphate synthase subunit HisH